MSIAVTEGTAQVYDLEAARMRRDARRAGEIPAHVWAEVEAANRLFEDLHDDGRRLVFDDRLDGRTVISLCDLGGRVLRSVTPGEVVDVPAVALAPVHGGAA